MLSSVALLLSCGEEPPPEPDVTYYTVTFDTGLERTEVSLESGTPINTPTPPTREGYDFFGWYFGGERWDFSRVPMLDITLTAKWHPTPYRITCVLSGGKGETPTSYSIESEDIVIENPTRIGYIFSGWLVGGKGDPVSQISIPKGSMGHRSFVATWKKCAHPEESMTGEICKVCGADTVVYYEEFGAVGDGVTDDFMALLSTHIYANENASTVKGRAGAEYYLGESSINRSIPVSGDVDWSDLTIIIDDSDVRPTSAPIFKIAPTEESVDFQSEIKHAILAKSSNVGFAPGRPMLLYICNSLAPYHYIRYGANANEGQPQAEVILVDKDGNVDPSTPIEWDYQSITYAMGYPVSEEHLTVNGNGSTVIKTIANTAPNLYTYYGRNFYITRSNVTVKGLYHEFDESGSVTRAPYNGFIRIDRAHNVTVQDCVITHHKDRYLEGSGGSNLLGTYEFAASDSNKISYVNCTQTNFYNENGYVSRRGIMGTNGCRNMLFDGCTVSSFDAHTAAYNATIRNSTLEHINFIGAGDILLENVTVYSDPSGAAIILRDDYGSTWNGSVTMINVTLKTQFASPSIDLIKVSYKNHDFGMRTYLPHTVTVTGLKVKRYSVSVDGDGNRIETLTDVSRANVYIYRELRYYTTEDISTAQNGNLNPYTPTSKIYINDCDGITWHYPKTPQFKNMKIIVDGEEIAWREN